MHLCLTILLHRWGAIAYRTLHLLRVQTQKRVWEDQRTSSFYVQQVGYVVEFNTRWKRVRHDYQFTLQKATNIILLSVSHASDFPLLTVVSFHSRPSLKYTTPSVIFWPSNKAATFRHSIVLVIFVVCWSCG